MAEDLGLVWLHVVSPPGIEANLPSVSENWGNFGGGRSRRTAAGRPRDATRARTSRRPRGALRGLDRERSTPGRRPALNFKHTLLPHVPWQYLPDARCTRRRATTRSRACRTSPTRRGHSSTCCSSATCCRPAFADHELGELLRHLKREGLWDKSLIVVAADHGVAFNTGERDRRTITRENAEQIAPIPLFIKAPGQREATVNRA